MNRGMRDAMYFSNTEGRAANARCILDDVDEGDGNLMARPSSTKREMTATSWRGLRPLRYRRRQPPGEAFVECDDDDDVSLFKGPASYGRMRTLWAFCIGCCLKRRITITAMMSNKVTG